MQENTRQQPLFVYQTNALSSQNKTNRGHFKRLALTVVLISSFGYLTFY